MGRHHRQHGRRRAIAAAAKKGSARPSGFKSAEYGYRRTTPAGRGGYDTVSSLFVGPLPTKAEGPGPKEANGHR
jgi:hypothetical protein